MSKIQLDMFEIQEELFDPEPVVFRADPDKVRRKLTRILGEIKNAESMPWDWTKQGYYKTVFPQMTLWLPDDEAEQFRLDFDNEMKRLA